jgi:hypothetical protein
MGRLEDARDAPDRTGRRGFFHRAAGYLSHAPIPGEMPPVQRFTCFSSALFSGKIESSNQNNDGLVVSGTARERLNVPT